MSNVIVIPIYKEKPSIVELSSYKNCLNILGKYDIYSLPQETEPKKLFAIQK